MRAFFESPHRVFLLPAMVFGLVFCLLTPPFGGGDEQHHFQRSYEVATLQFLGGATAPAGIAAFHAAAMEALRAHARGEIRYGEREVWQRLGAIALEPARRVDLPPSVLTQHDPFAYLVPAVAMRAGLALGLKPLWLLYLCRLASLMASTLLFYFAIKISPRHAWLMAFAGLLPTMVFLRGYLIGDGVQIGLSFLFYALIERHRASEGPLAARALAALFLLAFLVGVDKNMYLLLPFLLLLLPREKFAGQAARLRFVAAGVVPPILVSGAWLFYARGFFAHINYVTWGGEAYPDAQMHFILTQPLDYAFVVLRTLFATRFLPDTVLGLLGELGWMNVYLPAFAYAGLALTFAAVLATRPPEAPAMPREKQLSALIALLTTGLMLTLVYVQWTGLRAPVIKGFQGRYFYPLLPLLFTFLPAPALPSRARCGAIIAAAMPLWLALAAYALFTHYF